MQSSQMLSLGRSSVVHNRGLTNARPVHVQRSLLRRAVNGDGYTPHPEEPAEHCEETAAWNNEFLPGLQQRITQIKAAQALHLLQHGYQPTIVHQAVEESIQTRPSLDEASEEGDVHDWLEEQWKRLRTTVHDE